MSGLKWTRKTTEKIAAELQRGGLKVGPNTVARLLKNLGYSLRVNSKKLESGNKNPPSREVRNHQFQYINRMRNAFAKRGSPIISVDCKKKELIGNFKHNGTTWQQKPYEVNDHDFRNDAEGIAVPYSIYDTQANLGFVVVGTSHETPAFAVEAITLWWKHSGANRYPKAKELLILADCGGANSARSRVWKYRLQHQLCALFHLAVTVCHYPPGASKWNPIEHRLFSEISKNWAGKPLKTYETALNYIRTTKTSTGLRVQAKLNRKYYPKGETVTDDNLAALYLRHHTTRPAWNYTLN